MEKVRFKSAWILYGLQNNLQLYINHKVCLFLKLICILAKMYGSHEAIEKGEA